MSIQELIDSIKNYNASSAPVEKTAWGKTVYIKPLTTSDWLAVRAKGASDVQVVIAGVCSAEGQKVFTEEHEAMLSTSLAGPVLDLSHEILKLSGIIKDGDAKN